MPARAASLLGLFLHYINAVYETALSHFHIHGQTWNIYSINHPKVYINFSISPCFFFLNHIRNTLIFFFDTRYGSKLATCLEVFSCLVGCVVLWEVMFEGIVINICISIIIYTNVNTFFVCFGFCFHAITFLCFLLLCLLTHLSSLPHWL